ncbi:MAG: aspartate aminotransferase family protein [Rhodospirillaceae bacterium]|nr:aspartate aminotransferase family protein [Rhodospirillaceae bacterium]MBT5245809.1 aspartate aminotransferase family protein [Rhodospirillaceae bacterium]MBT5561352.1 aspartate aminotransferase family protein [Rhodospirillaceae bacterium]MBT6242596.1 aspartate aminotransferase family protein [Rhodospirillaceae bacterium]MBT7136370.1 aspartate aminotransferase family protein [Rhodospirillaceae bacterium]
MISNVMPTYARIDVAFERGEGAYLFDSDGRRYLDFASGIAVNALGHCHPHLVEAVQDQAGKLWHTSNLYHIPGQQKLADRLVAATFADSVFFANSGAEAVECSLKMARKYQSDQGHPERYRVITCTNAFHGRTLATIAAGGQEKHLAGFSPAVEGFDQVAFGNLNEMRAAIGPETAAIMIEPVQGEGGINAADPAYLKGLREAADEFDLLLIFDEVQCGMGRTGKLFAHEWAGVTPDIMAVAKAIGGGFPVAACLATERAALALSAGSHGSTFGGNPMAMAAANAVCDVIMEPGFLDRVGKVAKSLWARLDDLVEKYPGVIEEIRGSGLMIGIKCVGDSADFRGKLHEAGLLSVGAAENVIRLLPPLIIEQHHIDEAIGVLSAVCAKIEEDG